MPELPEVETIRRGLSRKMKNKKISQVEARVAKMVKPLPEKFSRELVGQRIKDIQRRAKMLIFKLADDLFLVVHLKLTGQLIYREKIGVEPLGSSEDLPNKFTHIIYTFSDGSKLFYNDVRKFGWHKLVNKAELEQILIEFGVEPLRLRSGQALGSSGVAKQSFAFETKFDLAKFKEILSKRPKMKIKQLLMDQSLIAGIGNIYSDEVLFYAGIHPFRPAGKLNEAEIKKLLQGIKKILSLAIAKKGTSVDQYVDAFGREGNFEPYLKVYQRAGEPCSRCQNKIQRLKLGGRSAHFCPKCQK